MSATNSTPIINLPLFIGTDKPAWLVDWNGAMNIIDTNISALQSAESGTAASLAALSQSVQALSGTVDQHTTALQTATQAIAGNTGSINTINSLIGNGKPTTTDKTIIGAINEINAKIPEGGKVAADDVTFDGTTSGLQATDVQAAIDEVNAKIPSITTPDAEDVSYDNTTSGLAASNVQAAIDELAQGGGSGSETETSYNGSTIAGVTIPAKFYIKCITHDNVILSSGIYKAADIVAHSINALTINTMFGGASDARSAWLNIDQTDRTKFSNGIIAINGAGSVGTNDTYVIVSLA